MTEDETYNEQDSSSDAGEARFEAAESVDTPNVEAETRSFEDLTLAELIGEFIRAPRTTYRTLIDVAGSPANLPAPRRLIHAPQMVAPPAIAPRFVPQSKSADSDINEPTTFLGVTLLGTRRQRMQLGMFFSAFIMAVWGSIILVNAERRIESDQLIKGAPFLLVGFIIWLGAEIYADWPNIKAWWQHRRERPAAETQSLPETENLPVTGWQGIHPFRVFAGLGTILFALIAWFNTSGNQFTAAGFWSWVASIILVVMTFAPQAWNPVILWDQFPQWRSGIRLRGNWSLLALFLIFLLAALFRLQDLDTVPPEMTSDHIEKLLDSWRVAYGDNEGRIGRDIFFVNNGGREPFQMYAMALLAHLPGFGIDFHTLKLLAVFEGLITMPVLWWAGREVIGPENRRLGNVFGLTLAALIAVSYWHVTITRLSLRIVLTPLVAALLLIYLSRAMRYNRREDYILTGLVLGFGLYTYQAVRMMPLVVVVGVVLAMLYNFRRRALLQYAINLGVLVIVSFIVFVPMFRFSVDYPNAFWQRTAGRLLGDEVIQETDAMGNIRERNATIEARMDALKNNLPVLAENIRTALLMFNWKGDVAWINGVPNHPFMDSITGALLIVGLAAWLALAVRSRDPVFAMVPVMVFIMLLPSALSIAAPLENPSATRTSGSMPPAYMIAALPLALVAVRLDRLIAGRLSVLVSVGLVAGLVLIAYSINAETYFNKYRRSYELSWKSHSAPGRVLRAFAESDGSYGNAFIIHYTHWLDHRIVGLEGGIIDWMNAVISIDKVPDFLSDQWRCIEYKYRLDPERDILFFVHYQDAESERQLQEWFPDGRMFVYDEPEVKDSFRTYLVPALGEAALSDWIDEYKVEPRCWTQIS